MRPNPIHIGHVFPSSSSIEKQDELSTYATSVLSTINSGLPLRANQKLKISAYSHHLPFIHKVVEAAYRDFNSGLVLVTIKESELESLKLKHGITEDFNYKKQKEEAMDREGAAFISLDKMESPYIHAGLSQMEESALVKSIDNFIPDDVKRELEINPEEILKGCLSLRKGQPLSIVGSREHMPQILQLAEWAYKNGTRLVDVIISEKKEFDLDIPFYKYAADSVLTEVPEYVVFRPKELLEKNVVRLLLDGKDPNRYESVDSERIQSSMAPLLKKIREFGKRLTVENPWCVYYLPTIASSKAAGYSSLKDAAIEARKITRVGQFCEHVAKLKETEEKLNALVNQGYRKLHFLSVYPGTENPDGKTNLNVGLTPKSLFVSGSETTPSGQVYMPNVPTEECFTTPDWTKTSGVVSMTRPVSINGSTIEGIQMEFSSGKVVKVSATKNVEVLRQWVEKNENADKLGEVALVAGSPIFDLGRVFKSILLDENATCHFALGSSYSTCIEGADDFSDPDLKEKYMNSLNCNDSPVHVDFMIGGPNVMIFAEKADGSRKVLIKDNKFEI